MINRTFTYRVDGRAYVRISKRRARALYNAGHKLILAPVNMIPESAWCNTQCIGKNLKYSDGGAFDTLVNAFEYYNCNTECGEYAAYYARLEAID